MVDAVASPLGNSFTVYAQPSGGFFGLTELETFVRLNVEPYLKSEPPTTLILDFSAVKVWDIAALLWMVVGLDHFHRYDGLSFRLRLPEGRPGMSDPDRDTFDRAADYLRRWRLDRALQNIDSDVRRLLVPSQTSYFIPPEPRRFYIPSKVLDEGHLLQAFMSRRLTEIRSLSDPSFTGSAQISPDNISRCIREFQAERIGDILTSQCGIDKRKADLFADEILTEALLNIQEHPNATIALFSISLMGRSRELILSVVDNGESIPSTIYPRYKADYSGAEHADRYDRGSVPLEDRGRIADHATKPGVTSKSGPGSENAGMGLTYIKRDTVNDFAGKLTIVTDGVKLTYSKSVDKEMAVEPWLHPWRGNLLRIAIPMKHLTDTDRKSATPTPKPLPQV